MTRAHLATILALSIGIALCCLCWSGVAKADTVSMMRTLCGARGVVISPLVDAWAGIEFVPPVLLGALIASESGCWYAAVSKAGKDIGLGQLRVVGSASYGWSRKSLFDPEINVYLTARHLAMWLRICKGYVPGALSGYRGLRGCRDSKGSQRVLRLVAKAMDAERKS
jgi:hypothetical protein